MKISPASATGFWNELYFYRAVDLKKTLSLSHPPNPHKIYMGFYGR